MAKKPSILRGENRPLRAGRATLLGPAERAALISAFDGWSSRGGREGREIRDLEEALAADVGVAHAVTVNSGTSALAIALAAAGVGPGDEVLVPSYTFAATAHAILHAGATPVFTDIEPDTLCLSAEAMRGRLTSRTRAVLPVHIGGKPADMDAILAVARENRLLVIEDAAQAQGASYGERKVAGIGHAGIFSFGTKLLTAFRGGALLTDDPDLAATARRLRYHGLETQAGVYVHKEPARHLTMSAAQAALLLPQLASLPERFALRSSNGDRLAKLLGEIPGMRAVMPQPGSTSTYYMVEALFDLEAFGGLDRTCLVAALTAEGLPVSPVSVVQHPIYRNPSLSEYATRECPNTESAYPKLLVFGHLMQSLVLHESPEALDEIAEGVALVQRHAGEIAEMFAASAPDFPGAVTGTAAVTT